MGKIVFGYWNIRGYGEIIRMLLAYGNIEHDEKQYVFTEDLKFPNDWHNDKVSSGLSFPNLPYLIDGDVKMTESWAIYRYLGRKLNLVPKNDKQTWECDMLEKIVDCFRADFVKLVYDSKMEEILEDAKNTQQAKLKQIDDFMNDRMFVAGEDLTFVDFAMYDILDWCRILHPDILEGFSNINNFIERFETLDSIADYLRNKRKSNFPLFGPFAVWGGKSYDDRTW